MRRVLMMDGMEHRVPGSDDGCWCSGQTCENCGGYLHYQPVWGGFYHQCEACGNIPGILQTEEDRRKEMRTTMRDIEISHEEVEL